MGKPTAPTLTVPPPQKGHWDLCPMGAPPNVEEPEACPKLGAETEVNGSTKHKPGAALAPSLRSERARRQLTAALSETPLL